MHRKWDQITSCCFFLSNGHRSYVSKRTPGVSPWEYLRHSILSGILLCLPNLFPAVHKTTFVPVFLTSSIHAVNTLLSMEPFPLFSLGGGWSALIHSLGPNLVLYIHKRPLQCSGKAFFLFADDSTLCRSSPSQ